MKVSAAFQMLKAVSEKRASAWLIRVRMGPTTAAMISARRTMAGRQAVARAEDMAEPRFAGRPSAYCISLGPLMSIGPASGSTPSRRATSW